jgi:hypothetical protein
MRNSLLEFQVSLIMKLFLHSTFKKRPDEIWKGYKTDTEQEPMTLERRIRMGLSLPTDRNEEFCQIVVVQELARGMLEAARDTIVSCFIRVRRRKAMYKPWNVDACQDTGFKDIHRIVRLRPSNIKLASGKPECKPCPTFSRASSTCLFVDTTHSHLEKR